MSLNIKAPKAHELAKELANLTGESMTQAVITAIRERLLREKKRHRQDRDAFVERVMAIGRECAALPILDPEASVEMLYDDDGLPK